jgi:hypothetical protein
MGRDTLELEHDYYLKVAELYDTVDLTFPMPSSNTQRIGAIAESRFTTECLERNFEPHLPTTPMPWDFIVTCPAGSLKVQIKASSRKSSVNTYCINSGAGCKSKDFMCETIDVVGCYIIPEQTWWMIPRKEIKGVTLKLNILPDSKSKYKKYQENWSIFYE